MAGSGESSRRFTTCSRTAHSELEEENIMTIAVICVALLALLIFVLGFSVSLARARTETISGYKNESTDPLYKLVRAHGNTTEYVPILAVLMLYLGADELVQRVGGRGRIAV